MKKNEAVEKLQTNVNNFMIDKEREGEREEIH
jgi:hypothetical protein